jgi:hypothetical protein
MPQQAFLALQLATRKRPAKLIEASSRKKRFSIGASRTLSEKPVFINRWKGFEAPDGSL